MARAKKAAASPKGSAKGSAKGDAAAQQVVPPDPDAVARRVFAPERARLAEAWAAVEGLTEPAEAWEALASRGLIPMEWVGDARRQVLGAEMCPRCAAGSQSMGHAPDCADAAVPASVRAAVALASDADGIALAETLAREAYRRMSSDDEPERVVWRVLPGPAPSELYEGRPGRVLRKHASAEVNARALRLDFAVANALAQRLGQPERKWARAPYGYWSAVAGMDWRAMGVARAVREDFTRSWAWDDAVREKRPNPFAPLCEIWQQGYKLETFSEEMVVLVAVEAPAASEVSAG